MKRARAGHRRALALTCAIVMLASAPAAASEDEGAPRPCSSCIRGAFAVQLGGEGALVSPSGPNSGPAGFALGVDLAIAAFAHTSRSIHHVILDGGLGVGFAGLQGTFDGAYAIGFRVPMSRDRVVDHGPFLRAGAAGFVVSNPRVVVDSLELPVVDLGWSLLSDRIGFQVAARGGLAAAGRYSFGDRFGRTDYRNAVDAQPEIGGVASFGYARRLYVDGRLVQILPPSSFERGAALAFARACVSATELLLGCIRFGFASTEVRREPEGGAWSAATLTYVGLTFGIGIAGVDRLRD